MLQYSQDTQFCNKFIFYPNAGVKGYFLLNREGRLYDTTGLFPFRSWTVESTYFKSLIATLSTLEDFNLNYITALLSSSKISEKTLITFQIAIELIPLSKGFNDNDI